MHKTREQRQREATERLNLQWAREALEQNGTPVTAENLVTITGQQVTEHQAQAWLASQAEGSHETEEA